MCTPDSPFMEARTGIVNLDENPYIIRFMLDAMYCEQFERTECMDGLCPDLPEREASILCFVQLYAIADNYQAKDIKTDAEKSFYEIFVDRLYPVIGHGKTSLSIKGFINVVNTVFETTPESDRTLRNLVFRQTNKNFSTLVASTRFQSEMRKVDGFWSGYANRLTFSLRCRRTCPECGETIPIQHTGEFVDGEMLMRCPIECGSVQTTRVRNQPMRRLKSETGSLERGGAVRVMWTGTTYEHVPVG
ncbi:hypothetical protein IWX90DRAFT_57 [Phyllosticta citrichinensis]|uniref:Uncharacterized protein n=1 Tax=Phyllosticta citrichinensis TaxID=1130410 RepID=A0ABR1Y4Q9_9PEZI